MITVMDDVDDTNSNDNDDDDVYLNRIMYYKKKIPNKNCELAKKA
jgi:hypothetical protein